MLFSAKVASECSFYETPFGEGEPRFVNPVHPMVYFGEAAAVQHVRPAVLSPNRRVPFLGKTKATCARLGNGINLLRAVCCPK